MTPNEILDRLQPVISQHALDSDSGLPPSQLMAFMAMAGHARSLNVEDALAAIVRYAHGLPIATMVYAARADIAQAIGDIPGLPAFDVDTSTMVKEARNAMFRSRFKTQGVELPPDDPEPTAEDLEREADEEGNWQTLDFAPEPERPEGAPTNPPRRAIVEFFAPLLIKAFLTACSKLPQGADGRDVVAAITKAAEAPNPVLEIALAFQRHSTLIAQAIPFVVANPKLRETIEDAGMPPELAKRSLQALDMLREAVGAGASGVSALMAVFYQILLWEELPPPPIPEAQPEADADDATAQPADADPMAEAFAAAGWGATPTAP